MNAMISGGTAGFLPNRRLAFCVLAVFCCLGRSIAAEKAPASTVTRTLSLSGDDWRICNDREGTGRDGRRLDANTTGPSWIPATVPGNIQADLEAAHRLKPLWYGNGDARLADVARTDWWYRKDFVVPPSFVGKRVALVFDGVDYECEVWLKRQAARRQRGHVPAVLFRRGRCSTAGQTEPFGGSHCQDPPRTCTVL